MASTIRRGITRLAGGDLGRFPRLPFLIFPSAIVISDCGRDVCAGRERLPLPPDTDNALSGRMVIPLPFLFRRVRQRRLWPRSLRPSALWHCRPPPATPCRGPSSEADLAQPGEAIPQFRYLSRPRPSGRFNPAPPRGCGCSRSSTSTRFSIIRGNCNPFANSYKKS